MEGVVTIWIIVAVAVVGIVVLRPIYKQYRFGVELTKLTNIVERIEGTRLYMPPGSGGGFDSLPGGEGVEALIAFERGVEYLRRSPRHEVTRELVKNARLASNLGRPGRVDAILRLLGILQERDVALNADEFLRSYS